MIEGLVQQNTAVLYTGLLVHLPQFFVAFQLAYTGMVDLIPIKPLIALLSLYARPLIIIAKVVGRTLILTFPIMVKNLSWCVKICISAACDTNLPVIRNIDKSGVLVTLSSVQAGVGCFISKIVVRAFSF